MASHLRAPLRGERVGGARAPRPPSYAPVDTGWIPLLIHLDTNVNDWYKCYGWIQMSYIKWYECWGWTQVGFHCWSIWIRMLMFDTNVRVGFKWVIFNYMNFEDGHRLELIVDPFGYECLWFMQMLMLDTNVRVGYKWVIFMYTDVEDGHRLELIVDPFGYEC